MQVVNSFTVKNLSKFLVTQHAKDEETKNALIEKDKQENKVTQINGDPIIAFSDVPEHIEGDGAPVYLVAIYKIN